MPYTPIDSVVYSSRPGEWKLELGDYLGDLTDEVTDNRIIEFVTGGPKNYACKIARPDKDGNTTICKVRGITLNYKNSLTINFDTIKDMVINNRDDVKTTRSRETTRDYLPYIKTKTTGASKQKKVVHMAWLVECGRFREYLDNNPGRPK